MKSIWILIFMLAIMLVGGCTFLPSVCDNNDQPSVLCDIAEDSGMRLEDIGNTLIVVNAVAINEGEYTEQQAADILKEIRHAIDSPVSYLFFKAELEEKISGVPGLFAVASDYLSSFVNDDIMHEKDRMILMTWLDNRIDELENGSILSVIMGWFK